MRRFLCCAVVTMLLGLCTGPVFADSDPRFYALPGVGVGPFWIGEPMELATFELWRLTNFAHDDQGRSAAFVDSGVTLYIRNPGWCISEDDGVAKMSGYLTWV